MTTEPTVEAPLHSLDPADWFMYCDLLQDQARREEQKVQARREEVGGASELEVLRSEGMDPHPEPARK